MPDLARRVTFSLRRGVSRLLSTCTPDLGSRPRFVRVLCSLNGPSFTGPSIFVDGLVCCNLDPKITKPLSPPAGAMVLCSNALTSWTSTPYIAHGNATGWSLHIIGSSHCTSNVEWILSWHYTSSCIWSSGVRWHSVMTPRYPQFLLGLLSAWAVVATSISHDVISTLTFSEIQEFIDRSWRWINVMSIALIGIQVQLRRPWTGGVRFNLHFTSRICWVPFYSLGFPIWRECKLGPGGTRFLFIGDPVLFFR